jgi:hypothetical protein
MPDYSIDKEVTVTLTLSLAELTDIDDMVQTYRREVADKLPNGTSLNKNLIINELARILKEAKR